MLCDSIGMWSLKWSDSERQEASWGIHEDGELVKHF